MNLFSGRDTFWGELKCPDQLDGKLAWDLKLKLTFPVENLSYLIADRLAETLNQPEEPWPAPE